MTMVTMMISARANSTSHGLLCSRSRTSCHTGLRCAGGGWMRSRVVANTARKQAVASTPYRPRVSCQPSASSPRPSRRTRPGVSQLTRVVPAKAAMKRQLTRAVRCWLSAVITPESAEYGMLSTV